PFPGGKRELTFARQFQFIWTAPADSPQNPTSSKRLLDESAVSAISLRKPPVPLQSRLMWQAWAIGLSPTARIVADQEGLSVGVQPEGMIRQEHSSSAPCIALSPQRGGL